MEGSYDLSYTGKDRNQVDKSWVGEVGMGSSIHYGFGPIKSKLYGTLILSRDWF